MDSDQCSLCKNNNVKSVMPRLEKDKKFKNNNFLHYPTAYYKLSFYAFSPTVFQSYRQIVS
jgi:hypothetical protein